MNPTEDPDRSVRVIVLLREVARADVPITANEMSERTGLPKATVYRLCEQLLAADLIRRQGYQAALCLAEALKFYGQEEMPAESAFHKAESLAAFRNNPANFARTRLRELQAMLPAASDSPGRGADPDNMPAARKAWWKIW